MGLRQSKVHDEGRVDVGTRFQFLDRLSFAGLIEINSFSDGCSILSVILEPAAHKVSEVEQRGSEFGEMALNPLEEDVLLRIHVHVDIEVPVIAFLGEMLEELVEGLQQVLVVYRLLRKGIADIGEVVVDLVEGAHDLVGACRTDEHRCHNGSKVELSLLDDSSVLQQIVKEQLGIVIVRRINRHGLAVHILHAVEGHVYYCQSHSAAGVVYLHYQLTAFAFIRESAELAYQIELANRIPTIDSEAVDDRQLQFLELEDRGLPKAEGLSDMIVRHHRDLEKEG